MPRRCWTGDWVDAAAALTFFVVKDATLAWARQWTGAAIAEHVLEDAPSDSERAAMAAGHGCLLAGAGGAALAAVALARHRATAADKQMRVLLR